MWKRPEPFTTVHRGFSPVTTTGSLWPEVEVCERVGVARSGWAEPHLSVVLDRQDRAGRSPRLTCGRGRRAVAVGEASTGGLPSSESFGEPVDGRPACIEVAVLDP